MSLEDRVARALAEQAGRWSAVPDIERLIARGTRARRRRRAVVTAIVATVVVGVAALSPMIRDTAAPAPVVGLPSPTPSPLPTATIGPGRGISYFLGSQPEAYVTFTMPVGWEVDGVWIVKTGSDPEISMGFIDVANIYTDGCQWRLADPRPGPTVDELVAAYAKVPGSEPAQDITVGGYAGKAIQVTVPNYDRKECKEDKFGALQHDNDSGLGNAPSFGRWPPGGGRYTVQILDVDGTRLVIFVDYPPNVSAQDRVDFDGIVSSIDFV